MLVILSMLKFAGPEQGLMRYPLRKAGFSRRQI